MADVKLSAVRSAAQLNFRSEMLARGDKKEEDNTNGYVWKQANILTGRKELLLATIKRRKLSWFGHSVMIRCLKSYTIGTVDGRVIGMENRVNRNGETTSIECHCRPCCASQTTEVDGRPSQRREASVGVYLNDAWASLEFVS